MISERLLTIGEFSGATQLSAKALRLYDEARLLPPAVVDAASGYRYYRREQIAVARLIRTLREMDVPLTVIAEVVAAPREQAGALLVDCAKEVDARYARQKRAFQSGLLMLHRDSSSDAPSIVSESRPRMTVIVNQAMVTRTTLLRQLHVEFARIRSQIAEAAGDPFCMLVEPLSEDESRVEIAVPVPSKEVRQDGVTRQLQAAMCVVHRVISAVDAAHVEAALDAMFDWLDRRACRASEPPCIALPMRSNEAHVELSWTYESATGPERQP